MSNYTVITNYLAKDGLLSGNPLKVVKGADFTNEFNAIATAIATKYDAALIAATAQILFANGTALLPSISFNAYPNTGLYLPSANSLGFSANGAQAGSISNAGNWNLNAPSSGTALTVTGGASGLPLVINNAGTGGGLSIANTQPASCIALTAPNGITGNVFAYQQGALSAWTFNNSATSNIMTLSGGGGGMQWTPAGNVTITAPTSGTSLAVTGTAGGGVILGVQDGTDGVNYYADASHNFYMGVQGAHNLNIFTNGTSNTRLSLSATGNLVINAPSSGTALTVVGAGTSPALQIGGSSILDLATGVTGWYGSDVKLGVGGDLMVGSGGGAAAINFNLYYNGGWKYSSTGPANYIRTDGAGNISIASIGSGTAGSAASITNNLTVGVNGNVTISAPASGVALTSTAVAGAFAGDFFGSSTSGQSWGLFVAAGTTANDAALQIQNQANSQSYFYVQGDGQTYVMTPTAGTAGPTATFQVGYLDLPQNAQGNVSYTTAIGDRGKHIYHNTTASNTFTIEDASVNYPVGSVLTFINEVSGGALNIAVQTDVNNLVWSPSGATGIRTLAANGIATAIKVAAGTPGVWFISGTGLS